jgi:predicted metal-dependent HD superfamily phosphohydrolase
MVQYSFIAETAQAWQLSAQEVRSMHDWVTEKVPNQYRYKVFTDLLRRKWLARTNRDVRP